MGTLSAEPLWVATGCQPSPLFQRVQGNRSPVESPPVAKKLLKAALTMPSSGLQFLPASPGPSPVPGGKENRSILKRVGATGARSRSWYGPLRKVNFELSVEVVVFDPSDGDYVCSESQRLNTEPKDRREFVNRTLQGRIRATRTSSAPNCAAVSRVANAPSCLVESQSSVNASSMRSGTNQRLTESSDEASAASAARPLPAMAAASSDVDFSFYEDLQGQLRLKFVVPLGPGVAAGDALVKANVAGNKVRVLGTRTVMSSRDGSSIPVRQEFGSRYSLPMDVDPYAITARMDGNGNLFVEAPVLTSERRRALASDKSSLSSATSSRFS